MTAPQPPADLVAPEGYTLNRQEPFGGGQVTWSLSRDVDGAGLGAYATQLGVDRAVAQDREAARRAAAHQAIIDAALAEPITAPGGGPVLDTPVFEYGDERQA